MGDIIWTFMLVLLLSERINNDKKEAQERLRTLYEAIPEAVSLSEYDTGVIVEANEKFLEKLGLQKTDVIGRKTTQLGFWGGEEKRRDYLELLKRDGRVENHEILVRKRDGATFTGLLSSRPIELGGARYILSIFRDIDERKRLENELEHQAHTDALTGVANRRHFLDAVGEQLRRSRETGGNSVFMMLDIDHFKRVNDHYGHQLGDSVLLMVTQAVRSVLRASDLFGRIGGEEFAVLLLNTDPAAAGKVAEKIRRRVESLEIYADADTPVYITVSIGVTKFRFGADTVEALIARADAALYQAKEEGRNRVVTVW
jgi:diguanylate cyclase (GGDEF)-like protein/PAS domain S-box-containing protein